MLKLNSAKHPNCNNDKPAKTEGMFFNVAKCKNVREKNTRFRVSKAP